MPFSIFVIEELFLGFAARRNLTFVEDSIFADGVGPAVREKFNERVNEKDGEGNEDCNEPLNRMEANDLENKTGALDDTDLQKEDDTPDGQEHPVFEESFKDIEFVVDLPRADHVYDLHQHK